MNNSWKNIVSVNNFEKNSVKGVDMGKYLLIIGNDATDIFKYYNVEKMHGLSLNEAIAEEIKKTVGNGVYIYGLTNYDPADKKLTAKAPFKPFLFLNMGTFKRYSPSEQATAIMHETMHMSILLNNWDIRDKEEEAIGFAEQEANKIINKIKVGRYL
jgi:hypothetical protein